MILRHFFSDIGYLSSFLISKNFQNFFHPTSILRQYLLLFTIDRSSFVHYHSPYPKIFKISSILRQYLLLFRASSFFITKNFQNFIHPTSILRQYLLLFTIDRSSFVHPYFSYSKISKISSIDPISFINRSILFPHCSSHPKISKISFIQHRSFANICFVHPHSSYPKICKISSTQHRSFINICFFLLSINLFSSVLILHTQKFPKFLPPNIDPSPISVTYHDRSILFRVLIVLLITTCNNFDISSPSPFDRSPSPLHANTPHRLTLFL